MEIKLYREELLYDISNYCYIEAHKIESESGNTAEAHVITDVCQLGNIDRIDRMLGLLHAIATEMLYPLTRKAATSALIDDRLWTPDVYRIELYTPAGMSETTLHVLARLLHEYMVSRCVHEWLSIAYPTAAAKWAEKTALCASELRSAVNSVSATTLTRRKCPW